MKILIVTIYNVTNYGAVLQTFATQEILSKYGDVKVLNYNNPHINGEMKLLRFNKSLKSILSVGKDLFRILPRRRLIKKFNSFIDSNLNITKEYYNEELLNEILLDYDIVLSGSDQVWNPACVSKKSIIDEVYFLNFYNSNAKKISYSSSFGSYSFSKCEEVKLKELLSKFSNISIREKDGYNYLQRLLPDKSISHVLDPTLLISKNKWVNLLGLKSKSSREKYILVYSVPKTKLIANAVDYFSSKLNLKIISIDQNLSTLGRVDEQVRDAGIKDFIELYLNAEFIITDSYHGTCFSINFEKNFVAISPGHLSNRLESILTKVGLKDRILSSESEFNSLEINIDYISVIKKLDYERKQSMEFLTNAVSQ